MVILVRGSAPRRRESPRSRWCAGGRAPTQRRLSAARPRKQESEVVACAVHRAPAYHCREVRRVRADRATRRGRSRPLPARAWTIGHRRRRGGARARPRRVDRPASRTCTSAARRPASADLGWKALAVAVSDLAAMGAEPLGARGRAGARPGAGRRTTSVAIYGGVAECARACGCPVVGGDVSRAAVLMLAVTVFGRTARPPRGPARGPGDVLAVTGALGGSEAGRLLLEGGAADCAASWPSCRRGTAGRVPRLADGRALAATVHAMLDVSDGVASDARRLAEASGVRVEVDLDALPLQAGVAEVAAAAGVEPGRVRRPGGEDYELLVALPPRALRASPVPLTPIGRILDGPGGRGVHRRGRRPRAGGLRPPAAAEAQARKTTDSPTSTYSNSFSTSGMCMRMQPCEAAVPIEPSSGVPWMPTAGADVPIQRVPSGLPAPGGIGSRPFAHGEFGGIQVGFLSFSVIDERAGRRRVPRLADRDRERQHQLAVAVGAEPELRLVDDDLALRRGQQRRDGRCRPGPCRSSSGTASPRRSPGCRRSARASCASRRPRGAGDGSATARHGRGRPGRSVMFGFSFSVESTSSCFVYATVLPARSVARTSIVCVPCASRCVSMLEAGRRQLRLDGLAVDGDRELELQVVGRLAHEHGRVASSSRSPARPARACTGASSSKRRCRRELDARCRPASRTATVIRWSPAGSSRA